MTTSTPLITGTDFITVATQDFDAAVDFYGGVLGLPESKRWGQMPAAEFETGNLTIAVMQSDAFGIEFRANNHPIEFHVEDFHAAHKELESRGVEFRGETHRLGRVPSGLLRGSGRQRAGDPQPLRAGRSAQGG